jgi:hypothetical protein
LEDILYTTGIQAYLNQKNGRISRKWWEWVLVGVSDVAGGVAGAAVGSGVASAAGAVAGAVGASSGMASLLEWAQE